MIIVLSESNHAFDFTQVIAAARPSIAVLCRMDSLTSYDGRVFNYFIDNKLSGKI